VAGSKGTNAVGRFAARSARLGPILLVGLLVLSASLPLAGATHPATARTGADARPAALSIPALTSNTSVLDLGMPLNASVNVSAISGGSGNATNLSFAWSGLPTNCTSQNVSNYTCFPSVTGTFHVAVNVTDFSDGQSGTGAAVSVVVNIDPTVTSISASTTNLTVNQTVTFTVVASGGSAPLVYLYSGLPANCSGTTATVTCQPTAAQTYNVTVAVIDAVNFTSNSAFVIVHVAPPNAHSSTTSLTTGQWAVIMGILVVGFLIAGLLWMRARREDRQVRSSTPRPTTPPPPEGGGGPPKSS
jgi:hypothetical protein